MVSKNYILGLAVAIQFVNLGHLDLTAFIPVWVIWDMSNLLTVSLVSSYSFLVTPYKRLVAKSLAATCMFLSFWFLIDYITVSLLADNNTLKHNLRYVSSGLLSILFSLTIYNALCNRVRPRFGAYSLDGDYLVYSCPKNIYGFIKALLKPPYGHVYFVSKGVQYSYNKGVFSKSDHIPKNSLCYEKCGVINREYLDSMVGAKWSIRSNCYGILRGLEKANGRG